MIKKIFNIPRKTSLLTIINKYNFSATSDPYYILGVQKTADFKQIKKCFFKLANDYHPDKNDTPDAKKKFLIVKQAFEQIKMEKGLMKPQNFVDSVSYDSVRSNASQFTVDEQEGVRSNRDYRMFRQKAQSDQKYQQFNSSFQTIHDINDIKIKVQQGQMKDPTKRFNLQSLRMKITSRSQSSPTVIIIGMMGLFVLFSFLNDMFDSGESNILNNKVIQSSTQIKNQNGIKTARQIKRQQQANRKKVLEKQELFKMLNENQQQTNNKDGKGNKSNIPQNAKKINIYNKLIEAQKQEFITSNERVL